MSFKTEDSSRRILNSKINEGKCSHIFRQENTRVFFKTGDVNHEYIPIRACSGSTAVDEITNLWLSTASSHFCDVNDGSASRIDMDFVMQMNDEIVGKVGKKKYR